VLAVPAGLALGEMSAVAVLALGAGVSAARRYVEDVCADATWVTPSRVVRLAVSASADAPPTTPAAAARAIR
jgi:hypothetical protein